MTDVSLYYAKLFKFYGEATLLIDERNTASLAVAARLGAKCTVATGVPPMQRLFVVPVRRRTRR